MKKIWKPLGITVLILFILVLLVLVVGFTYSKTYMIPEQAESIENDTGLVQAYQRSL